MLPDVVQDHVTDAARRLGFLFTEQVFYLAALTAGLNGEAENKARELDKLWKVEGWKVFEKPEMRWVKDFIFEACSGEYDHASSQRKVG